MSNFSYLSTKTEYSLFANSAIEAEKVFSTSPAMCAVGCRKALELAVKWVYAADKTITILYHQESYQAWIGDVTRIWRIPICEEVTPLSTGGF